MISKAKSTKGSPQAIDYILNDKGKAVELDRNKVTGSNGNEILREMRFVQSQNTQCKNNTISIVLSPEAKAGGYTQTQLRNFLHQHLENLGLRNNQYIASVHNSTDTQHIHIIANRINSKGEALNDSYISKKAQTSAEQIAKHNGMRTAKEVSQTKLNTTKNLKKDIEKTIIECKHKATSFDDFCKKMESKGCKVVPSYNSEKVMFGMRIESNGNSFKLSEINRRMKFYHFADIMPKETRLKIPPSDLKKPSNNKVETLLNEAIKTIVPNEVKGIMTAVKIASQLNPKTLAINSFKEVVSRAINPSKGFGANM